MMSPTKTSLNPAKRTVLFLALLITPLLSACDGDSLDFLIEMAIEWATSKNLFSCTPEGDPDCELGINYVEVGSYWAGYGTDPNVQAAFDTYETVNDINEADALAEEGFANGDIQKLQEAVELRPNDWSYDEQLSVLYLAEGNQQEASAAELDAERKAQEHLEATLREEGLNQGDENAHKACVSTYSNLYQHREAALIAQIDKDPNAANVGMLISQLDFVRFKMMQLSQNQGTNPCSGYGGGG